MDNEKDTFLLYFSYIFYEVSVEKTIVLLIESLLGSFYQWIRFYWINDKIEVY